MVNEKDNWRHQFSAAAIAILAPVLPLFMGGRTPFVIAYLADGLLVAVMAAVLLVLFWPGTLLLSSSFEQRIWTGVAVVFSGYVFLQVLPLPYIARVMGPYPEILWSSPGPSPKTWSPNPGATISGWAVFMTLWTAAYAVRSMPSRYLGWLVLAFSASALFQALYGLLAHAAGSQYILGIWERPNAENLSGTFTNRNLYTAYLSLVGPLAIFMWWLPDVPGVSRLLRPFRVAATIFTVGIVSLPMLGSGSRLGTLAGIFALTVSGFLWLIRMTGSYKMQRWYAVGLLALIILVLLWYGPAILIERFAEMGLESSRWEVWSLMLSEFPLHYWMAGTGLGSFEAVFKTIQSVNLDSWYFDAHNDLLQWLLETGLVGAILLGVVFVGLLRRISLTRLRSAVYGGLAAISLVALGDFSWHMAGTQLVIASYIGLLLRPVYKRNGE